MCFLGDLLGELLSCCMELMVLGRSVNGELMVLGGSVNGVLDGDWIPSPSQLKVIQYNLSTPALVYSKFLSNPAKNSGPNNFPIYLNNVKNISLIRIL